MAEACFALVAIFSLLVLVAWRLGLPREGVFDLAPSTLVMLLGFSTAAWLCQHRSTSAAGRWLGRLVGLGAVGLSGLVCARFILGYQWAGEEWLARKLGTSDLVPRVHMSKTAAFCFLLTGLAWLLQFPLFCRRRAVRQVAAVLALTVLLSGAVMLLCYLLQSTYYAQTAFLAAAGWVCLGLGWLITAGLDNWPLNLCFLPADETQSGRRFGWGVLSLVVLLVVTVLALGEFYFLSQEVNARRAAWRSLVTVVDLKAAQAADWRRERLADARILRRTPYVARRALDALELTLPLKTMGSFQNWLKSLFADQPFDQLLLLDEKLKIRLAYPHPETGELSEVVGRAAAEALSSKEIVVADLERAAPGGEVQLNILVPLLDQKEVFDAETKDTTEVRTVLRRGLFLLQVNARERLYPILGRWPASSATAETLLLRQEGDAVVILNDVQQSTNAALTLRLPMGSRTVEVRSILGEGKDETGQLLGPDYRGVPVLGVWRKVPDSPWVLLVKLDSEEVYAPIARQAWTTAGLAGLLIGVAILGVALLGRQRNLVAIQRELLMERRQRESEMVFRSLAQVSPVGIFRTDAAGNCLFVNARWCEITGLSAATVREQGWEEAVHPDDRLRVSAKWHQAIVENSPFSLEFRFQRPDGTIRWVLGQDAAMPGMAGEPAGRIGTLTDITASKRAEVALLEISDREQARIGQDLHDGLCQDMVVMAFSVESLERKLAAGETPKAEEIRKINAMLNDTITHARHMARGLFPVEMESEGLATALQSLANRIEMRFGLRCEMDYPLPVFLHDNAAATQLYRIAQEAVNNAVKHARPGRIEIRLASNRGQIELTVLDDGVGISDPPPGNGGMGLDIMAYRAKTIGGTLKIYRRERGGTGVSCFVYESPASRPGQNGEEAAGQENAKRV